MLKCLKFSASLLLVFFFISCNQGNKPKVTEVKIKSDSTTVIPVITVDTLADDQVSFISGVGNVNSECLPKLESKVNWISYSKDLDKLFSQTNSARFKKMKIWADSELINNHSNTTVFYPFSGPDFLNANIFYPDADQYILIAMEPVGSLPDICKMHPDSVTSYLNSVNNSLKDIFKRSYFITRKMTTDLGKAKVNGTLPVISLFIKRTGHNIVSIHKIGIDSTGTVQNIDSIKNLKRFVTGIKIEFILPSRNKIQTVYYLRADISDKGLEKHKGVRKYLSGLPESHTYLKAGSYLMHGNDFKEIRSVIFDKSSSILQDDSGIAYKYFDKSVWDIKLYGKYDKPISEFSYIKEPDLEKAYKNKVYTPLPFILGYHWGTKHSNLLYAVRKK
jgi:hypothetical protein